MEVRYGYWIYTARNIIGSATYGQLTVHTSNIVIVASEHCNIVCRGIRACIRFFLVIVLYGVKIGNHIIFHDDELVKMMMSE